MKIKSLEGALVLVGIIGVITIAYLKPPEKPKGCTYFYEVLDENNRSRGYTNDDTKGDCVVATPGKFCGDYTLRKCFAHHPFFCIGDKK